MTSFDIFDFILAVVLSLIGVALFVVAGFSTVLGATITCVGCGVGLILIAILFFYKVFKR